MSRNWPFLYSGVLSISLALAGCGGCERQEEPVLLVPPEGQLPKVAQPATTPTIPVTVGPGCLVILTPDVEEGPAPLEVRFTAEGLCSDNDGEFEWDFGDGSATVTGGTRFENGARVSHTYQKPGEYIARVTLRDPQNQVSDTDEYPITVLAPEP